LKEYKDTSKLVIFTLDISVQSYPIISSVENLPHDCLYLTPCTEHFGGLVVATPNSLVYIDQSSKRVALALNGWAPRISDLPMAPSAVDLKLEGSRAIFTDDKTLFLILKEGTLYPIEVQADGKIVTKLSMGAPLAQTAVPCVLEKMEGGHFFIGSTVGPSVLLKASQVEEEVEEEEGTSSAVVDQDDDMDLYDDGMYSTTLNNAHFLIELSDLYGDSKPAAPSASQTAIAKKTRTVLHLSLRDSLPAYGPISSMTFSLTSDGVSSLQFIRPSTYLLRSIFPEGQASP
jgi:cleavage and polyadenylation specificity factor subunit 1